LQIKFPERVAFVEDIIGKFLNGILELILESRPIRPARG
jgi:hypothetical protein